MARLQIARFLAFALLASALLNPFTSDPAFAASNHKSKPHGVTWCKRC